MRYPVSSSYSRRALLERAAVAGVLVAGGDLAGRIATASAAGSPAGYPSPNPAVTGETASLNVWLDPAYASQAAYKRAIALFQKTYPTISVRVTPVATADVLTRYKILAAAGAGNGVAPDLVQHHAYIFGAQGLAHESDALWSAYGKQSTYLPVAIDDVQWRTDKFGIPLVLDPVLTIVNEGMFHKAGVPLPTGRTTFSQFTQLVTRVQKANGTRYAMILSADGSTATAVVHANGGALFKSTSGRNIATLTDRRVTDALSFYTELGWKQRLAPVPPTSTSPTYIAQLFAAGQAPAFFGTLADLSLIRTADSSLSLALAPLPGGTTGRTAGSVNAGSSLVLTAATHKPHAAFELAVWMVAEPVALAVAESMSVAPTVAGYYINSYYHRNATAATYFSAAQTATPIRLDAYSEAYDLYTSALHSAFGGGDPAKLMTSIQSRCQVAMDKADAGIDSDG
jgi:N,N'-diacetylchitobiose transport system substrate-binding protein